MAELNSNTEWKLWGKHDPLMGVAAWEGKEIDGPSPWTYEQFYALGESDWQDFLVHWRQYGIDTESVMEIGCGAGRITRQLALTFEHVLAVDVSDDMIRLARNAVSGGNAEFSIIDGIHLPHNECSVKAIFSTHVLQHLDNVQIGFSYFRELFRVLDKGGTIMVHLPLYQFPNDPGKFGALASSLYAIYRRLDDIRAVSKRRMGRRIMRTTPYPIWSLRAFLSGLGFKNVEFRIFPLKSNGDPHGFVFATK